MNNRRFFFLLILNLTLNLSSFAQPTFSIGTGVVVLRNFSRLQKFWAVGQNVQGNFHFSPRQSAYVSLDYFTAGRYRNAFTATAKPAQVTPQQVNYTATGRLDFRQVSVGWKHFFYGAYNNGESLNIYGTAGFGLLFAAVGNTHSQVVDTALYNVPNLAGDNEFKRITFDGGLGVEYPLGSTIFVYTDARTWLPSSDTKSPYLHNQRNVPAAVMVTVGLRILFSIDY